MRNEGLRDQFTRAESMIQDNLYQTYLSSLLRGNKQVCHNIVTTLLEDKIAIRELYMDLIGLSLAVYFNIPVLKTTLQALQHHFKNLDILVGGHAFIWGGTGVLKNYPGTIYLESLSQLEKNL